MNINTSIIARAIGTPLLKFLDPPLGRVPIHVNEDSCEICYNPKDPVSGYGGIPRDMTVFATKLKMADYVCYLSSW